ncbi:ribonuclease P protein component 2 [Candidatus Woesearchaeota archaeon]|nr:ribonuclease P protein component 2 [Candidatus Woesearchaeota archaeon]
MKLLPSLRQKKRYVVFEVVSTHKFSLAEIKAMAEEAWLGFLGQLGTARATPMIIEEKYNPETQRFMVKVNHNFVDELKAALTLSKSIKNTPVIVKSIVVSGTIKKASASLSKST